MNRKGMQTSEFWAAQLTSVVLLMNAVFGLGIDIADDTAMTIVGGIQAAYALGRSIVKGLFGARG